MPISQIIFNAIIVLLLLFIGFMLVRKLRSTKKEDEDIEKLIEELTADDDDKASAPAAQPTPVAEAAPEPPPMPEPEPEPIPEPEPAPAPAPEPPPQPEPIPEPPPAPKPVPEPVPEPAPAPKPEPEPAPEADEPTARVRLQDVELSKEEIKKHEKAKRKARVIVREIEMYNTEKTEMGRKEGNLKKYLFDDIEAARKMYEKSVPEEIHSTTNYFEESLINLLAGGDKKLLGLE